MNRGEAVERYLQRATKGLWGGKRLEVREELMSHIDGRVNAYMIAGLSVQDAEDKALAELGAPQMVSTGMTWLYTLPTVMGSSLALVALCLAVVALWPKGVAQTISGSFYYPTQSCTKTVLGKRGPTKLKDCVAIAGTLWFSKQQLQQALEHQGVQFERLFTGNAFSPFSITFPESKPVYVTSGIPGLDVYDEHDVPIPASPGQLSLWHFLKTVAFQNDVKIGGWENPVVNIGDTRIRFGSSENPISGSDFYNSYLEAVFFRDMSRNLLKGFIALDTSFYRSAPTRLQTDEMPLNDASLQVSAKSSNVYGIVTYLGPANKGTSGFIKKDRDAFFLQIRRASEDSTVPLKIPQNGIRFVEDFGTGLRLKSGDSILVRLAGSNAQGKGWYEVVSPESVRLEPR